jgi:hypothetical protein
LCPARCGFVFGFVALFPRYRLIRNPVLMLVFRVLFLGNLAIPSLPVL